MVPALRTLKYAPCTLQYKADQRQFVQKSFEVRIMGASGGQFSCPLSMGTTRNDNNLE